MGWYINGTKIGRMFINGTEIKHMYMNGNQIFPKYVSGTSTDHVVNWNLNGGTGSTSGGSTDLSLGQYYNTVTLPSSNPTRAGYTFLGWSVTQNGRDYVLNSTIIMSEPSVTFYAAWEPIKYTIAFNNNGGTGSIASLTNRVYDQEYTLTSNTFTRSGYTFGGWATSATGAKVYDNNQSVKNLTTTNGATVTLYAVWSVNSYTITFKNSNGTELKSSQVAYGTTPTAPSTPSHPTDSANMTFKGWSTTQNDLVSNAKTTLPTVTGATTYYAIYSGTAGWIGSGTPGTISNLNFEAGLAASNGTGDIVKTPTGTSAAPNTLKYRTVDAYGAYADNAPTSTVYTLSSNNSKFTILSGTLQFGSVKAAGRGTTAGNMLTGTLTKKVTFKYGTNEKSYYCSGTLSQDANTATDVNDEISTYGTPTTPSIDSGLTAAGGSATISGSQVINKRAWHKTFTSTAIATQTPKDEYGTVGYKISSLNCVGGGTRFSISGSTLSHTTMGTNVGNDVVNVVAYNTDSTSKTSTAVSKTITNSSTDSTEKDTSNVSGLNQTQTLKEAVNASVSVSYVTGNIPASGGTKSPSPSYSFYIKTTKLTKYATRTKTTYTSNCTPTYSSWAAGSSWETNAGYPSTSSEIKTGCTVTYAGGGQTTANTPKFLVNYSSGIVEADSLGTEKYENGRSMTVTPTLNIPTSVGIDSAKSVTGSAVTVSQAKNVVIETAYKIVNPGDIAYNEVGYGSGSPQDPLLPMATSDVAVQSAPKYSSGSTGSYDKTSYHPTLTFSASSDAKFTINPTSGRIITTEANSNTSSRTIGTVTATYDYAGVASLIKTITIAQSGKPSVTTAAYFSGNFLGTRGTYSITLDNGTGLNTIPAGSLVLHLYNESMGEECTASLPAQNINNGTLGATVTCTGLDNGGNNQIAASGTGISIRSAAEYWTLTITYNGTLIGSTILLASS